MRIGKFVASGVSIVAVAGCLISTAVTPDGALAASVPAYEPGQLLVGFKSNADSGDRGAVRRRHGAKLLRGLSVKGLQLVKLPKGTSVKAAARSFERDGRVRYAVPNAIYDYASTVPNDPKFPQQWGLNNTGQALGPAVPGGTPDADIDAPEAWDTTVGSPSNTVAVVDSGIDYNHPDLAPNIWTNAGETGGGKETNGLDDDGNGKIDDWRGWDFTSNDNDPRDFDGHGTSTAGAIGARGNDGVGLAGVTWNTKLMGVRAKSAGSVADGFAYAAANGAKIVNASIDCHSGNCGEPALRAAIHAAPNTLFVFAAGNSGSNNDHLPVWPCNIDEPNVICVGASDYRDSLASFSNYGTSQVDLAAPGVTVPDHQPVWSTVYSEGFEDDISSTWTTGGTNDSWARTSEQHQGSGNFSLSDSPDGNYQPETASFVQKNDPIDLAGQSGCRLNFGYKALFPSGSANALFAQVSTDGSSWQTVVNVNKPSVGPSFSGGQGAISQYDGQSIYVRFFLRTTNLGVSPPADGVYVDNLTVSCLGSGYSATSGYALADGTSIAAPYVSGAAALLFAHSPSASASDVKTALLRTVDVKSGLSKLATSGRLNVWRALHYAPPAAPTLSTISPASGSNNNGPKIKGNAPAGTTVLLYTSSDCSGGAVATGSAATFGGSGLTIGVADNSTTSIRGRAFSEAGGISECSAASVSYHEVTPVQKFESSIAAATTVGIVRNKAFFFGAAGLRPDPYAGWSVSLSGKKLAADSNNQQVIQGTAAVQPGTCPVAALGTKSYKTLAFYNENQPGGDPGACQSGYASARFGGMSTDNRGRQVVFSANFPFDTGVEASEEAPQVYLWHSSKLTPVTTSGGSGWGSAFPALSGDGRQLMFASNGDSVGQNEDANMELFSYDTSTKQTVQLTHTQGCSNVASSPQYGSPGLSASGDGNRIVFQSDCDLGGQNPAQDTRIFVYERSTDTYNALQKCSSCAGGFTLIDALSISQDGNTVVNYYGHFLNGVTETMAIHDLSHVTNSEVDVESIGPIGFDFANGAFSQKTAAPSLTADGSRIVFTAQYDPVGNNGDRKSEVFLLERGAGGAVHQLTDTKTTDGQDGSSQGQVIDPSGQIVYLMSNGVLWGKQSLGAFRVRLKAQK